MSGDAAQTIQEIDVAQVVAWLDHITTENERLREENADMRKRLEYIERNARGILGTLHGEN